MFLSVGWAKRWLPSILLLLSLFLPWWTMLNISSTVIFARTERTQYFKPFESFVLSFPWRDAAVFEPYLFSFDPDPLNIKEPYFTDFHLEFSRILNLFYVNILIIVGGLIGLSRDKRARTMGGILGILGVVSYVINVLHNSPLGNEFLRELQGNSYFGNGVFRYFVEADDPYGGFLLKYRATWFLSIGLYVAVAGSLMLLSPYTKRLYGKNYRSGLLLMAFASLTGFVAFQQSAINNHSFLFLTVSSFIFLVTGTSLTLRAFVGSFKAERLLSGGVAVLFIVATLFVANSLAQIPRGGMIKDFVVRPECFTITAEHQIGLPERYYYGQYEQIIHSTDYPVASVKTMGVGGTAFLNTEKSLRMNLPTHYRLCIVATDDIEHEIPCDGKKELVKFMDEKRVLIFPFMMVNWGTESTVGRPRLEGYYIRFEMYIGGSFAGPDPPPVLNFTVDMSRFSYQIREFLVTSQFLNNSSIFLSTVLVGVNSFIPGELLYEAYVNVKKGTRTKRDE